MRIWVDGCFDFFHHGHAGALNQARALGDALVVGIHTDEEILANKGPVVMHLDERVYAVDACRWTSEEVSGAPYVTDYKVMDAERCEFVAHGDDITTDADGNDTYQQVKDMGRFLEFKRTPNISTTDLIGRMLTHTTQHHEEASDEFLLGESALERFRMYSLASNAKAAHSGVYLKTPKGISELVHPQWHDLSSVSSKEPSTDVVYVEGAFDLFHCGHIEFLERVKAEVAGNRPIVVGLRSDSAINAVRGEGLPIMNIFERALCVLQCKFVDGVVLNVPYSADGTEFFKQLRNECLLNVVQVARGPTPHQAADGVVSAAANAQMLARIDAGKYAHLKTQTIVDRVLSNRAQYEERQRKKGVKAANEKVLEQREKQIR